MTDMLNNQSINKKKKLTNQSTKQSAN